MLTQAQHFAERVQREKPDLTAQVVRAHSLALGREPGAAARDKLIAFAEANGLPGLCRWRGDLIDYALVGERPNKCPNILHCPAGRIEKISIRHVKDFDRVH